MTGYFAFPPRSSTSPSNPPPVVKRAPLSPIRPSQSHASQTSAKQKVNDEKDEKAQDDSGTRRHVESKLEEKRRKSLEHEQKQIWQSELEWVRSGGVLRDAHGRRDKKRTEMFRAEIRLQDEERQVQERWNAYEIRIRALPALAATTEQLSWKDVPWPVWDPPSSPDDLTPDDIATFIFSTLKIRGSRGSKKEKVRSALLRWHPDKFPATIYAKVAEEERDMVADGVSAVFMGLKLIQDVEKKNL